ncbi:hypothetical protein LEP1GSC125_2120 [Leptospira mayottensis 200901122]|uniref:Uncharacterized protein n=1 Tax=Leptospira mayottensis 200901122 TaxID=1193010 RepID=A0AA87MS86_9LEPT|nr:hypothetical protein LEP1GSC125_2120 [Leptospira mayottensis 200901122]
MDSKSKIRLGNTIRREMIRFEFGFHSNQLLFQRNSKVFVQ